MKTLNDLLKDKIPAQVAKEAGMPTATLYLWMKGIHKPVASSHKHIGRLAKVLGIEEAELRAVLGVEEVPQLKKLFLEKQKGQPASKIAEYLGIDGATLSKILVSKRMPTFEQFRALAKWLGISQYRLTEVAGWKIEYDRKAKIKPQ